MKYNFDNERPIYIQLVEFLKKDIISGKFSPNEKIPSVREFAMQLQINPNTIQRSLQELENQGLIYTERTNGKFVTNDIIKIKHLKENNAASKIDTFLNNMKELGVSTSEIIDYITKKGGNK